VIAFSLLEMQRGIESATALVRAYAGSDVSKAVCAMLEEIIASYKVELMTVKPDELVRLQSLILQTEAIRAIVSGDQQHGTAQL
jgi:hypothetical protein